MLRFTVCGLVAGLLAVSALPLDETTTKLPGLTTTAKPISFDDVMHNSDIKMMKDVLTDCDYQDPKNKFHREAVENGLRDLMNRKNFSQHIDGVLLVIFMSRNVNHLDISPRFAGILMAFTNCSANLTGLLAPIIAGYIIEGRPTQAQWRIVFYIAAAIYIFCATFYNVFSTGVRQDWDNPADDEANAKKAAAKKQEKNQRKAAQSTNQAETTQ